MYHQEIKEVSDFLFQMGPENSELHPLDRFFLEPFVGQILQFDRNEFIIYNFNEFNTLYNEYLMLCLPELWDGLVFDDIINIIKKIKGSVAINSFIFFTYKRVEIDLIEIVLDVIDNDQVRREVFEYLDRQCHLFIKIDMDLFFIDIGALGIKQKDWQYIKQKILIDTRIKPGYDSVEDLKKRVRLLREKYQIM